MFQMVHGKTPVSNSVLGNPTGNKNLDGTLSAPDFNTLAGNFGRHDGGSMWFQGDFNYDGKVNTADFTSLASNFGLIVRLCDGVVGRRNTEVLIMGW